MNPRSSSVPLVRQRFGATMLALLTLCATAASGCVSVDAEVEEMQVTRHGLVFEGAPVALDETLSMTQSFNHDHSPLTLPTAVDSDIRATEVTLTAGEGTPDLSFIEGLFVVLRTNDQGEEQSHVILSFEREGPGDEKSVLTIPTQERPNLADAWRTHSGLYEVTVWGKLPDRAWSVDVGITFTGNFSYGL